MAATVRCDVAPDTPAAPNGGALRRLARGSLDAIELAFDRAFAPAVNPWRNLGGLAFLLFWIVASSGIYVYVGFDTRVDGAYASVERLSSNAFPLGAFARSLHRYASDAFVLVALLHLAREWIRGRYAHFRRFSWTTGVVTLWFLFASGIGGFWLVWDAVAQYSLVATMEWFDALPGFDGALVRNFVADGALTDRLFSLLIFLHIGLPLALLALMWLHLQRLAQPATSPPRALAVGALAALALLSLVRPVESGPPADLAQRSSSLPIDWFYLWPHALADATSPATLWVAVLGATALLLALPWASRRARAVRPAPAVVSTADCNGCARCYDDCPYAAVTMQWRTDGKIGALQAVVDAGLCAACGICAGACPSSTPFRAGERLSPGIDLPALPVERLRATLEAAVARLARVSGGPPKIVVFGCAAESGVALERIADARTAVVALACAGQLPPSFVEYALRAGADGVVVTGCREGDCDFRFGNRLQDDRLAGVRAPRLRAGVPRERVCVVWSGRGCDDDLARAVEGLRARLADAAPQERTRPKRMERSAR